MENAWRFRMVRVAKENSKTNVLLNNHHNLSLQTNLSVLHSLTVLCRVRGAAPSQRGADVVRLQPSSVAFERTAMLRHRKKNMLTSLNFVSISFAFCQKSCVLSFALIISIRVLVISTIIILIRADSIPLNATT